MPTLAIHKRKKMECTRCNGSTKTLVTTEDGVLIKATGGTFDKVYDPIHGVFRFDRTHVPEILERAGVSMRDIRIETLFLKDSLDMTDDDRQAIVAACREAPESRIVIVHGTDTMDTTAIALGKAHLHKTIVLVGAMIPCSFENSDAAQNLFFALGVARSKEPGVFVAMHAEIFTWDNVQKNRELGRFETIR